MSRKTYARTISVPFKCCNKCNHFEPCRSTETEYGTGKRADDIFCAYEVLCNDIARQIVSLGPVEVDDTEYEIVVKEKDKSNHEADKEQETAVMSPKSFLCVVEKFIADELHPEDFHVQTDELMEELLTSLGYGEGIKAIQSQIRWYA